MLWRSYKSVIYQLIFFSTAITSASFASGHEVTNTIVIKEGIMRNNSFATVLSLGRWWWKLILHGSYHPLPSSSSSNSPEKVSTPASWTLSSWLFNSQTQMLKIKPFKNLKQGHFPQPSGNSHFTWFVVASGTFHKPSEAGTLSPQHFPHPFPVPKPASFLL